MQKSADSFVKKNYYTKAIAISPDNLKWIKEIKGKKSAAGKLNEIIEFYKFRSNLSINN